jgi:hypothetical protein
MHDALSRLSIQGEGRVRLTPGMIRQAFVFKLIKTIAKA